MKKIISLNMQNKTLQKLKHGEIVKPAFKCIIDKQKVYLFKNVLKNVLKKAKHIRKKIL